MKRVYTLCIITCLVMSLFSFGIHKITREDEKHLKVGFIFVGDEITPYTNNFIKARDRCDCGTGSDTVRISSDQSGREKGCGSCRFRGSEEFDQEPALTAETE